ncbi:BTB/POZ protein [Rhizophagus irregularis DAOM 181602=DAOM 197198]|nr:BTB/POZ protein [Rhizophagus irregularis DAOM 181602=DAOM 197198]
MNILCYRSPYLRQALASNKKNNDNILSHIKLPNTSPEIFQIILEYIYGGILSLDEKDTSDFLKVLATADKLSLQELVDYLQGYLIENRSEWLEQHFGFTQQISSQSNNLLRLQEFCTNLMVQSPEKVLKSLNFTSFPEKSLISIIKRTEEIIGGYNPSIWESCANWVWGKAEERFIFSFKNKNNFKDAILSKIIYSKFALCFGPTAGPHFGGDINICASNVLADYNFTEYFKGHYEKNIRDSEGKFTIEDYEVFKITKK